MSVAKHLRILGVTISGWIGFASAMPLSAQSSQLPPVTLAEYQQMMQSKLSAALIGKTLENRCIENAVTDDELTLSMRPGLSTAERKRLLSVCRLQLAVVPISTPLSLTEIETELLRLGFADSVRRRELAMVLTVLGDVNGADWAQVRPRAKRAGSADTIPWLLLDGALWLHAGDSVMARDSWQQAWQRDTATIREAGVLISAGVLAYATSMYEGFPRIDGFVMPDAGVFGSANESVRIAPNWRVLPMASRVLWKLHDVRGQFVELLPANTDGTLEWNGFATPVGPTEAKLISPGEYQLSFDVRALGDDRSLVQPQLFRLIVEDATAAVTYTAARPVTVRKRNGFLRGFLTISGMAVFVAGSSTASACAYSYGGSECGAGLGLALGGAILIWGGNSFLNPARDVVVSMVPGRPIIPLPTRRFTLSRLSDRP